MPRPQKPLSTGLGSDEYRDDVLELAQERHPLNVQISEYDWMRAQELAIARRMQSVSDIVRHVLVQALNEAPEADLLHATAMRRLENELHLRDIRRSDDQEARANPPDKTG